jgi:hypothetical protein
MTEQELRALVRDAVARHLGRPLPPEARPALTAEPFASTPCSSPSHASHALYVNLVNVSDACLIEPAVGCSHCGYCQSHGH